MRVSVRLVAALLIALLVVLLGSRPVRQPESVVAGPPPAQEVLATGRAGGVPVDRWDGRVPVLTDPGDLRVAVSPWVAFRFGRTVLRDASAILSPPDSRLRVRFVVRLLPARSDHAVTGAGLQIGRCGAYHGLARFEVARSGTDHPGTIPLRGGRVHICGDTFRLEHDQQVALLVHEVAHLVALGHVCEGRACIQGEPPGCTHLMAGRWWEDCDGDIDLTSIEAALVDLYPRAEPSASPAAHVGP